MIFPAFGFCFGAALAMMPVHEHSMSRFKNFSRNLATSYLQMGVNVAYSLVSVPIILHWLPRAEFGLWALLIQLMTYIYMVDLGVNQAIARFLVDHKDCRETGEYGALLKTSALVSAVQGMIVLLIVFLGSPMLASLMKIPVEYQPTFINLLRYQGMIAAFMFCTNPLGIMLSAHQRMDIQAWQSIFGMILSLCLLVLFLNRGCGIYSFIYASAINTLLYPWYYFWHCWRLGFLPRVGEWGKVSWQKFRQVFSYGKDVFLMNVGIQLVSASQTIVVSRALGLENAAAWAVGTKIFMLLRQVMYQPTGASLPGLSEMLARKEIGRLKQRFCNLVGLTASLGVFLGMSFALCNSFFVSVWTSGKISWPPINDVLLCTWFCLASIQTTHTSLVFVTKHIGRYPVILIFEGCAYISLALTVGYHWKVPGIIICSVVCLALFSCQFSLRQTSRYFQIPMKTLLWDWLRPSFKLALLLGSCAPVVWLATIWLPCIWRLLIHAVAISGLGCLFFIRFGLSSEIQQDLEMRIPRRVVLILKPLGLATARNKS